MKTKVIRLYLDEMFTIRPKPDPVKSDISKAPLKPKWNTLTKVRPKASGRDKD